MDDISDRNWFSDEAATFGDRLAAAREAQGATQKTLARRMGIALKTLEGWENDLREPRANKLQLLSGILDVSMSWLLTGEGQGVSQGPEPEIAEVTELLREMRQLKTEMQQSAERLGILEKRLKKAVLQPS